MYKWIAHITIIIIVIKAVGAENLKYFQSIIVCCTYVCGVSV